eukprot:scaffold5541_cov43-Cyclotella_meneghiniana.AAC.5
MIYPITITFLPSCTPSLPVLIPQHQPPCSYLRVPRGGESTTIDLLRETSLENLDDSDIDQMVEDLIAGVDSSDQEAGSEEQFAILDTDDEDEDQMAESAADNSVMESPIISDEPNPQTNYDEHNINTVTPKRLLPIDSQSTKSDSHNNRTRPNPRTSPLSSNTIPTNAYYRFLVRRGPKGHILASFSLLTIQWLYTYLPFVYKFVASILLTLRIYDPQLLHVKERERMLKEQRRRKKTSLTDKLFKRNEKKVWREADERATSKLQELYRVAMSTSVDWREVRYSYLSTGFRKRHGLGEEYVVKKPMRFMGEKVGGGLMDVEDVDVDDIVIDEDSIVDDDSNVNKEEGQSNKVKNQKKSRKVTDWVVKSFGNQHFLPSTDKSTRATTFGSTWKSVQRQDILSAAWESRNAEKSIWTNEHSNHKITKDANSYSSSRPSITKDVSSNLSSASASKMFQSVMTRVGSNGRILGAYPMDAPPIEECCNRRGVIQLARKYGYGDWSANDDGMADLDDKSIEQEHEFWGGGDLDFGEESSPSLIDSDSGANKVKVRSKSRKNIKSSTKRKKRRETQQV